MNARAMRGASAILLQLEDNWATRMGGWFQGERVVFRGKDLFGDLKDLPWMGLLLYGITGRSFSAEQLRLFEGIWVISTSYPDPRLWNNRVAALAASSRSTVALGLGAATAVSEAAIYGGGPGIRSIDALYRAKQHLDTGGDLDNWIKMELKAHRGIAGYGRPLVRSDERIRPLLAFAQGLGRGDGPYTRLAFDVEQALLKGRWRLQMNVAALIAGLAADQGLSAREYHQYMTLCFSAGMFPCFIDAAQKPEGGLFPLRCSRIEYQGKARRKW